MIDRKNHYTFPCLPITVVHPFFFLLRKVLCISTGIAGMAGNLEKPLAIGLKSGSALVAVITES